MELNAEAVLTEKSAVSDANDRTHSMDGLPSPTDNVENVSAHVLLASSTHRDAMNLLDLASISSLEPIADAQFERYFRINGETERHQSMYCELLSLYGDRIRAVQIDGIRHIDGNHWLLRLLNDHTPNLVKLCFAACSFANVDHFLSLHKNLTHLTFRGGGCDDGYRIELPEYRSLRSLELFNFSHISKSSLEQIICNNPQMQRLVLKCCDRYFKLSKMMELISSHLPHLTELNLVDDYDSADETFLPVGLTDRFVSALTSLEAFGMTIFYGYERNLLRSIGSKCKRIKHFELYDCNENYNREIIELISLFDNVNTLSLFQCCYKEYLPMIVANLPDLRRLTFSYSSLNVNHFTNAELLAIIRQSEKLAEIVTETEYYSAYVDDESGDESGYSRNVQFHAEFIKAISNPRTRLEFKENGKVIGIITKDAIIWRNKLMHWVGYDPIYSQSQWRLLDLATNPTGSSGKHKQPLNLVFNYLDLDSLYSFCMASKECKHLIHSYIQHRCKPAPPAKKCTKQRSIKRSKFFVTDEFGQDFKGLKTFGKSVKCLDANLLHFNDDHLRDVINEHCKIITTLCLRARQRVFLHCFHLTKVQHFIFDGYDDNSKHSCNLDDLSHSCPNLETLELRTKVHLYVESTRKPISFPKLKTIQFKPSDDSQIKFVRNLLKHSTIEIIIDS